MEFEIISGRRTAVSLNLPNEFNGNLQFYKMDISIPTSNIDKISLE